MNRVHLLAIVDKKSRNVKEYEEFESYSKIAVKNTARSLKKALKKYARGTIIVSQDYADEYILKGYIKPYKEISNILVMEIIENVCRAVAFKHGLRLPLEDLYLYARPEIACEFIKHLVGLSRIYTIISDSEKGNTDELYFEYGCPIRHIAKRDSAVARDSVSIFIEKCGSSISPIINLTEENVFGENVTDLRKISVMDDSINELTQYAFPNGGLPLYTLLGKKPSENIIIDISKTADIIFLLDTNAI